MGFLCFILFTQILSLSSCSCVQCILISSNNCKICYNTCLNQSVEQCQKKQCLSYGTDHLGTSYCIIYKYIALKQKECIPICCQINSTISFIEQLKICQQLDHRVNKNLQLSTILIVTTPLIAFVVVLLFILNFLTKSNEQQKQLNTETAHPITQQIFIWEQNSEPLKQLQKMIENCSICFGSLPNTKVECSHRFHLRCIIKWLSNSTSCPLCRHSISQPLLHFCSICLKRYVLIEITQEKYNNKVMQEAYDKCPSCKSIS